MQNITTEKEANQLVRELYETMTYDQKAAFRKLWIYHEKNTRETFYKRLMKPTALDYYLIAYFMEIPGTDYIADILKSDLLRNTFRYQDGTPYPTISNFTDHEQFIKVDQGTDK